MKNLFEDNEYSWTLFMGHLVIEKLIKAYYVKKTRRFVPPMSHDLLILCEKSGLYTNEEQKDTLDLITTFNISARYPDYKQKFYKKCTPEFTEEMIIKIEELRAWLLNAIKRLQ